MLAADTPSPWIGVLWFGLSAAGVLFIAWRLRWQLANNRTPGRSTPRQQRFAMWGCALMGFASLALALRELFRAVL